VLDRRSPNPGRRQCAGILICGLVAYGLPRIPGAGHPEAEAPTALRLPFQPLRYPFGGQADSGTITFGATEYRAPQTRECSG
jgi:hypothetical protein